LARFPQVCSDRRLLREPVCRFWRSRVFALKNIKEITMKKTLFAFALSLALVSPALAEDTTQAPAASDASKPAHKAKKAKTPGSPETPAAAPAADAKDGDKAAASDAKPAKKSKSKKSADKAAGGDDAKKDAK